METDFTFEDHGSLGLLTPNTPEAKRWVHEKIQEGYHFFGKAVVIEHGYADDVLLGIIDDGFTIG